jgi:hypothetical protein
MADLLVGWRTAARAIGLSASTLRSAVRSRQLTARLQTNGTYAFVATDLHAFKAKYEQEAKIRAQLSDLEQVIRSGVSLCRVCGRTHPAQISISLTPPGDAPCRR